MGVKSRKYYPRLYSLSPCRGGQVAIHDWRGGHSAAVASAVVGACAAVDARVKRGHDRARWLRRERGQSAAGAAIDSGSDR
jgi:hypothetical protein